MDVRLESHRLGVVLPVKAQPAARKSEIRGAQEGALKVAVTQVAEKGKANQAIIALLSKKLLLSKAQFKLIAGETSTRKRFLVDQITVDQLKERIQAALQP